MFYGPEQATIHDGRFGNLARFAAADLLDRLAGSGLTGGTVVDLGCGSGILAREVGAAGFDVVGVDISPDMIALAQRNSPAATFSVGSLHTFNLPPRCVGVASTGEALNYATDPSGNLAGFTALAERVFRALEPAGWWLFDLSGPGRGGPEGVTHQFVRTTDWCLGMNARESVNDDGPRLDREITVFVREPDGRSRRVDEHHVLNLYRSADIADRLGRIGFAVSLLEDFRFARTPKPTSLSNWYVVAAQRPV
ncbi:MAG TPA: class I SAM-dependent methyltransferase [Acidimicrobiales bacterium]|jgi:SAM-dependent methyltransferase|nr:class I SAM-dependent methyltransferase [Acidimicrobiales bacterium]